MPTPEEIQYQQGLLDTYRKSLSILLKQLAIVGPAYIEPRVVHDIDDARDNIQRIKQILRKWQVSVTDHPDDTKNPPDVDIEDLQDFSQINLSIRLFASQMMYIATQLPIFSQSIYELTQASNIIPKEELKVKFQSIIREFINEILLFNLSVDEINNKYDIALKQKDLGLKKLLNPYFSKSHIPKSEISAFIATIQDAELNVITAREKLFELINVFNQLNQLIIQKYTFENLNKEVGTCIEKLTRSAQLVHLNLQFYWQVRGIAEGLLRSAK